jgi:phage FluMu protein gp41
MAEETITLRQGLKIGDVVHTEAVLREPTVEDLIEAGMQAERVVEMGGEAHLVRSPTLAGLLLLGRQIVRIGDHKGPLGRAELLRLDTDDFVDLQQAADRLDAASAKRAAKGLDTRGRSDPAR